MTDKQESPCGTVIFISPEFCQDTTVDVHWLARMHVSLRTPNASLKVFIELWNTQKLARMPRNLYTQDCRTQNAGQDSTWDCSDAKTVCPTSRQTVSY